MRLSRLILPVLALTLLPVTAFAADEAAIQPAEVSLGRPVDFEKDILPILDNNCIACHNVAISESKLILEDVESIVKGGKRGTSIVAGEPDKSLLYQVAARSAQPAMPPMPNKVEAKTLSPNELGLLRLWIQEGAKASADMGKTVLNWQPLSKRLQASYAASLSPWGRVAASARANRITVYDVTSGVELAQLSDPNLTSLTYNGQPMYAPGTSHRDLVHALEFSPDGNMIASAGYRVVKLWKKGEPAILNQTAAPADITASAVSRDGKWLALATADNSVTLWNATEGQPGPVLKGHTAKVTGIAFNADATQIITGSEDKSIRVWNVAEAKEIAGLIIPNAITSLGVNKEANIVMVGQDDKKVTFWNTPTTPAAPPQEGQEPPKPIREAGGLGQPAKFMVLLEAKNQLLLGCEDGIIRILDINNAGQVRNWNHGGPITGLAASPDGQIIASVSSNQIGKIWHNDQNKQLAELKGNLTAQREVIRLTDEQAVSGQRVQLATQAEQNADKNVKDREEGVKKAIEQKAAAEKALEEAKKKEEEEKQKRDNAKAELDKDPENGGKKTNFENAEKAFIQAEDARKRAEIALEASTRGITRAEEAVVKAKEEFEQSKKDKTAAEEAKKQVDQQLEQAKQQAGMGGYALSGVAISADGKYVYTAGESQTLSVWDSTTGQAVETLTLSNGSVQSLATSTAGKLLVINKDKSVHHWNVAPGWNLVGVLGPNKDTPLDLTTSPFADRVLCLDFSNDGKLLAAGGGDPSRSGEILIFDVQNMTLVREFEEPHSDTVLGLEFSWDGKRLVSGAADKFVKLFDVETGKVVRAYEGHTNHVLDVAIKADGSEIVSAGADNQIKVWNVETGEQKRTIQNYSKQVTSIQYIGTNDKIASCGGDQTVRLHNTSNGQNYRSFGGGQDFMYSVAITRDEQLIIATGEDGVLRIWNAQNGQAINTFEPPKEPEPETTQTSTP